MPPEAVEAVATALAALAAVFALYAALASLRAMRAGVFDRLVGDYFSPDFNTALRVLSDWKRSGCDAARAVAWGQQAAAAGPDWKDPVNDARRLVLGFYRRAANLLDIKLVRRGLADELRNWAGKDLVREVVIPLTTAMGSWGAYGFGDMERFERLFWRTFFPDNRQGYRTDPLRVEVIRKGVKSRQPNPVAAQKREQEPRPSPSGILVLVLVALSILAGLTRLWRHRGA